MKSHGEARLLRTVLLVCFAATSCATIHTRPASAADALASLEKLRAVETAGISVSGSATLRVSVTGGRTSFDVFAAVAGSRLKLEATDLSGAPLFTAVSNGTCFEAQDARRGSVRRGNSANGALFDELPFELSAVEMAALLQGRVPELATFEVVRMESEVKGGRAHLTLAKGPEQRALSIETVNSRLVGWAKGGSGGLSVRFDDFVRIGAVTMPRVIEFKARGGSAVYQWQELQLSSSPTVAFDVDCAKASTSL